VGAAAVVMVFCSQAFAAYPSSITIKIAGDGRDIVLSPTATGASSTDWRVASPSTPRLALQFSGGTTWHLFSYGGDVFFSDTSGTWDGQSAMVMTGVTDETDYGGGGGGGTTTTTAPTTQGMPANYPPLVIVLEGAVYLTSYYVWWVIRWGVPIILCLYFWRLLTHYATRKY
jgi:hypothetical protein